MSYAVEKWQQNILLTRGHFSQEYGMMERDMETGQNQLPEDIL